MISRKINVLSCFDGMSCGQIALKELGIGINNYYASEVDKYAIEQTQLNFPNTIQLGDVSNWRDWNIDWGSIDLVIGGFCCQSFSMAGHQKGFDDDRGQLFFTFADIIDFVLENNPKAKFLGENVKMAERHQAVIDNRLNLRPVEINSSLVSAQNRVRLYWSNIKTREDGLFGERVTDIVLPEDKNIYLKDVLEKDVDERFYLSDKAINGLFQHKKRNKNSGNGFGADIRTESEKSQAVTIGGKGMYDLVITHSTQPRQGKGQGGKGHLWKTDGKSYCIDTGCTTAVEYGGRIRRLTPKECARLQTIPDWYKWECSNTQQYKMLGNGWTVEVIKHIFSFL